MAQTLDEQAVWQRVGAAARAGGGEDRAGEPVSLELVHLAAETRQMAALCGQLLTGAGGTARQTIQQAARQLREQAEMLEALYRFRTGTLPEPQQPPRRTVSGGRADLLRTLLQELEHGAGRLEALAARCTGQSAQVLLSLLERHRQLFPALLRLLISSSGRPGS